MQKRRGQIYIILTAIKKSQRQGIRNLLIHDMTITFGLITLLSVSLNTVTVEMVVSYKEVSETGYKKPAYSLLDRHIWIDNSSESIFKYCNRRNCCQL